MLPACLRHGLGVLTYSPLAGGWLTAATARAGRSGTGLPARRQRFAAAYDAGSPANAAKLDAADALGTLADEAGSPWIQMAIAFVTRHPAVTSAIVGPRTLEHLSPTSRPTASSSPTTCSTASTRSCPRAHGQRRRQHVGHEHVAVDADVSAAVWAGDSWLTSLRVAAAEMAQALG